MEPTDRQIQAFQRFLHLLPHGKEKELVILKGHLLIEEQVRLIISKNLLNPDALEIAKLDCHQAICLAQAILQPRHEPEFWNAVRKLNKLRNDIAHKLSDSGLQDRIDDFVTSVPVQWEGKDKTQTFELSIWSLFVYVSSFV